MTFTEISEKAGDRLRELVTLPTLSAVSSCIGNEKYSNASELLDSIGRSVLDNSDVEYFAEATVAKKADPVKTAEMRLKNGFNTGGKNVDMKKPPEWSELHTSTRNFRYKMHSWVMLDTLLSADEKSEENKYLDFAVNIAYDWIKNFILQQKTDEFAWYDMAVGQRATKLPYMLFRLIQNKAPKELIFHFILACEIHIVELSQRERIAVHSNHGLFQIAGLIALVRSLPWLKISKDSYSVAIEVMREMLNDHFSVDGLHKEHSPEYHLFMVNHLSSFLESGWLEDIPELVELVSKVEEASHWMQNPKMEVIPLGDSKNSLASLDRWHAISKKLKIGLKVFHHGGLAIQNTSSKKGKSQLVFSAQFHSRQHKHADHLNVLYYLNGHPLLVDAGTYTYQYDLPERIYCESTRSHNTVEIDGLNYSRFRQDSFGSCLDFVEEIGDCTIFSGKVHHKHLVSSFIPNNKIKNSDKVECDVEHTRIIVHYPERFLAIIDQINSSESHDYIQWNHIAPHLSIRKYTNSKVGIHNSKEESVCIVLTSDTETNPLDIIEIEGQSQPHLQGWFSHDGTELIPNPVLGFSTFGENKAFVTVFDFKMKNTGKPYIRVGSNGNYQRFALTQDGSKVDFKIRKSVNNNTIIEATIDGKEFSKMV